jgi:hypothetical protein
MHILINKKKKKAVIAGHWWLTPVILATQEAEISTTLVRSQTRQIVPETLGRGGRIWSDSKCRP